MRAWRVYGLDRIQSLSETETSFKMPKGFDVENLFSESFGVFFPKEGQKSVTVRFKATEEETRYLRDLPIHSSQVEESSSAGEGSVFRIRLIPDENLLMEFCRRSGRVVVLEPEDVKTAVKNLLTIGYEQYQ